VKESNAPKNKTRSQSKTKANVINKNCDFKKSFNYLLKKEINGNK